MVTAALRTVRRHVFIPEVPLSEAYADEALVIKRDSDGYALSSLSQPTMVAIMLEQLDVRPGQRVLEVGAGTGYNAALLAAVVGDGGRVTTIEFDPAVSDRARSTLAFEDPRVEVIQGDGEVGFAPRAPYDRMIVTVGAWDIPPAWWDQLAPDGQVVVPLRIGGLQRSVAFRPIGPGRWRSVSIQTCAFVPMQGAGAFAPRTIRLDKSVALHVDDDVPISDSLREALEFAPVLRWTGVHSTSRDVFGDLELWLLTATKALGRLGADTDQLVAPVPPFGTVAVVADESFAYLARRSDDRHVEYGVAAYGSSADDLAAAVTAEVQAFAAAAAAGISPVIEAHRVTATEPTAVPGALVKRHSRLEIEWLSR
jgi:protein-L-isoaspartate(D-aspartate) O-methyltransferase